MKARGTTTTRKTGRPRTEPGRKPITAKALLESGLVGLWEDRKDISSSSRFARRLRNQLSPRRLG